MLEFWPFASPWLLGWAAAAAVPVLLHLWNRRPRQEIDWAAMRFLLQAVRARSRRVRVEQLVLLLLRVLIVLGIAAAAAEPFLPGLLVPSDRPAGRTHRLFVLDGSHSMGRPAGPEGLTVRTAGGVPGEAVTVPAGLLETLAGGGAVTAWRAAVNRAAELAGAATPGDGLSVIVMGPSPRVVIGEPAFDAAAAVREIRALTPTAAPADATATLAAVGGLVAAARRDHPHLDRAEVVILTDGQARTWTPAEGRPLADALAEVGRLATVRVETVAVPEVNRAVTGATVAEPLVRRRRAVPVTVTVAAWPAAPAALTVDLLLDGRTVGGGPVAWTPGGAGRGASGTVVVPVVFPGAGTATLTARIDGDGMPADDRFDLTVPVREGLTALVVGDRPEDRFALAAALAPTSDGDVAATETTAARWTDGPLTAFDLVVLTNVATLREGHAADLAAFVRSGGSAWLFPGDRTEPAALDRLQSRLTAASAGGAAPPSGTAAAGLTWGASEGGVFRLAVPADPAPAVAVVAGEPASGLFLLPSFRVMPLTATGTGGLSPGGVSPGGPAGPTTLLTWTDGRPAIVSGAVGRGRWTAFGFAGSTASRDESVDPPRQWTTLPTAGDFVSLVQELIRHDATRPAGANDVRVGDVLRGDVPTPAATGLAMIGPDGTSAPVPTRPGPEGTAWTFAGTDRPGSYRLTGGPAAGSDAGRAGLLRPTVWAVRVDPTESDPTTASGDALDRLLAGLPTPPGPSASAHPAGPTPGAGGPPTGAPLAFWVLAGTLGLLVTEAAWAWRIRRAGGLP